MVHILICLLARGPNDDRQNEQLDIAYVCGTSYHYQQIDLHANKSLRHHMFSLLLNGRLLLAPIDENIQVHVPGDTALGSAIILTILQTVLDLGTGTGIVRTSYLLCF